MKALFILIIILFISCETPEKTNSKPTNKNDGIVKTYDESGDLQSQISYENGVKQGKSLLYHKGSDQVLLEMNYKNGERNGEAFKYYENGGIYAITPYENDEVNGVVKLYYRNGKIKAEIPYYFSKNGLGLKEYYTNGDLKTEMPEIISRKQIIGKKHIFYFSIENCTEANFFVGALFNNKFLMEEPPFVNILPMRNSEGIFGYPENLVGETINVICKCRTSAKNPYVTRKVIAL